MEVLIMSCSTGGGHNSAGRAVAEELERRGHNVTFLDPYKLVGERMAAVIGDSYIKLVQKSPHTFGAVYALGEAYRHLSVHSPVYLANRKMADCTSEFLNKHHYDVVIMSHIYPAHILTNLRENKIEIPKTYLIATDYTCIPFMEEAVCDYYVIPSEDLYWEFYKKGIPGDKILPFGIPVGKEFSEVSVKREVRKKLELACDRKYILLSGGSIGAGKIEKTVKSLVKYLEKNSGCELVIVCGNNKELYQTLQKKYVRYIQIHLLQSTTQMADYMKACDVFISKPGGLSSTEAAVSQTPLIHISPIPGCESRNADFFKKRGMSIYVKKPEVEIQTALEQMKNEAFIEKMKQAQKRYINGMATDRLCDFIENEDKGFFNKIT